MERPDRLLDLLTEVRPHLIDFTQRDRDLAAASARKIRLACEKPGGPHGDLLGLLQSYAADLLAYINVGQQQKALDQVDEMIRLIGDLQANVS